jgi:hypothetical protein
MNAPQAVKSIDLLLDRSQQRKLNDLESAIVLQIWEGSTYQSIAEQLSYEPDYIKQVAARLWKLLSKVLGENICKGNIRSALERHQTSISIGGWYELMEVDIDEPVATDFKVSKTLMVSDLVHSIVVSVAANSSVLTDTSNKFPVNC